MSKILVLEDDAALRGLLREALEQAGHEVANAADGDAGIRAFKKSPADLVITDIFMPEKDGLDVIRELKAGFPEVKSIAISGGGRLDKGTYLMAASGMGADHVLGKPFEIQDLVDAVREVLG